jgi:SAM-dependent methyltransferase
VEWWQEFFDQTYYRLWSSVHPPEECDQEARDLVRILGLSAGDRILDAPCGYGRIALPLAKLGLLVTGVDYSPDMLGLANEKAQAAGLASPPQYLQADLRDAQLEGGFDAAINLFSSIGYGSEEDDLLTLSTLHRALRPGGVLYLDTMHRDAFVTRRAVGDSPGVRGPQGLTLRERNRFDPVEGQIHSTWTWNSPTHSGSRSSTIRLYSATELVKLIRDAGFAEVECRVGISERAFGEDTLGERLGLLCRKD